MSDDVVIGATTAIFSLVNGVVLKHDPITYAGVTLLLMTVAGLACFVPARRASRVNPVVALREG